MYPYHNAVLARQDEFNRCSMTLMAGALFKHHRNMPGVFPGFFELIYLVTRPEFTKAVSATPI